MVHAGRPPTVGVKFGAQERQCIAPVAVDLVGVYGNRMIRCTGCVPFGLLACHGFTLRPTMAYLCGFSVKILQLSPTIRGAISFVHNHVILDQNDPHLFCIRTVPELPEHFLVYKN